MDQIKELQEQIEALKKTVEELQSGTVKVVSHKERISQAEMDQFRKYFIPSSESTKAYENEPKYGQTAMARGYSNWQSLRLGTRDLFRLIFKVNQHKTEMNILTVLKDEGIFEQYLEEYGNFCKVIADMFTNEAFKKGVEE